MIHDNLPDIPGPYAPSSDSSHRNSFQSRHRLFQSLQESKNHTGICHLQYLPEFLRILHALTIFWFSSRFIGRSQHNVCPIPKNQDVSFRSSSQKLFENSTLSEVLPFFPLLSECPSFHHRSQALSPQCALQILTAYAPFLPPNFSPPPITRILFVEISTNIGK